jgi:hypothetical protein
VRAQSTLSATTPSHALVLLSVLTVLPQSYSRIGTVCLQNNNTFLFSPCPSWHVCVHAILVTNILHLLLCLYNNQVWQKLPELPPTSLLVLSSSVLRLWSRWLEHARKGSPLISVCWVFLFLFLSCYKLKSSPNLHIYNILAFISLFLFSIKKRIKNATST